MIILSKTNGQSCKNTNLILAIILTLTIKVNDVTRVHTYVRDIDGKVQGGHMSTVKVSEGHLIAWKLTPSYVDCWDIGILKV